MKRGNQGSVATEFEFYMPNGMQVFGKNSNFVKKIASGEHQSLYSTRPSYYPAARIVWQKHRDAAVAGAYRLSQQ